VNENKKYDSFILGEKTTVALGARLSKNQKHFISQLCSFSATLHLKFATAEIGRNKLGNLRKS
jgi:hypothetical protein